MPATQWLGNQSMSIAKLKTRIKNLVKKSLFVLGFKLIKPRILEREIGGLKQGVEFQPGTGHLDGQYTLNVYWRFNYIPKDYISFDANRRIGELMSKKDTWFSHGEDKLETDFAEVTRIFDEIIIPYFEEYSSLEKLVDNYSTGKISKQHAFGLDHGWQCFNAGFTYAALNNKDKAIKELNELINKHSIEDYDWVKERKILAQQKLSELKSA